MTASATEASFQENIISEMVACGWVRGDAKNYHRESALYREDCLTFVKQSQAKMWEKFCGLYPTHPEAKFLERLEAQLAKVDPQASDKHLRQYGTLGVLRHGLRDKSCHFKLCQFKPDHDLNADTRSMYEANLLRVVPEVTYSPYSTAEHLAATGKKAKAWRLDLVLFINGLPIATMELKSDFKQDIENAIKQYKYTRLPKDPETNKPEPLLTFKRGALVHFAVSQYEAWMTTRLEGKDTHFLPFNKGTKEGGAGNDAPEDQGRYATDYLWSEVLRPDSLLNIIGRYIHLSIKEKEDGVGRKWKDEALIFPRYHQWDLVTKLLAATRAEGTGHKYLAQHSAGSGKSNSIAWTAHQLASMYRDDGEKFFHSVIVVTDRNVLDSQLQDTIYQFEHKDGVVVRINDKEGQGSKSQKLADALSRGAFIIIVTIQTFPFVLDAIANNVSLRERRYAVIADEAHSSQSGGTANRLKEVLQKDAREDEEAEALTVEDLLANSVSARRASANLSYYAFTATPKSKTLELFGRCPNPAEPPSARNKPQPFHIYSMRQAIEENYILDVLRNYTTYKVAYQLAQKATSSDTEVDSKKARSKLGQWVKLHDYNISQKVQIIVEHFRENVASLLGGQAKAMVVTGSRKEAVRYKLGFDKYVAREGYQGLQAMVAFSGEVEFSAQDPNSAGLLGEKFTEANMNPGLKGRDLRKAFDSADYSVMIVANKFQTGFDQPKLCAMYVDKKLGGVECVQTLSRLNRVYPGKLESGTFILDFFNDADEVLASFQEYYQTAKLIDVSDPEHIWLIQEKLIAAEIFLMSEVTLFSEVFYKSSRGDAAIRNVCQPAVERWRSRYKESYEHFQKAKQIFEHTKKVTSDAVLIGNAETEMKDWKKKLDALGTFKADLVTFTRYYEFMSQIIDYDSTDLEKLSLYARHLAPHLREASPEDDIIDLSSVELSHYRLSKLKQQELRLAKDGQAGLEPGNSVGTRKARDKKEEFLSQIIERLNETFITDGLSENDLLDYARTITNKVSENAHVMHQVRNNSPDQAMLGDFASALDDAVMESSAAHQNQMNQILGSKEVAANFGRIVFDLLVAQMKGMIVEKGPPSSRRG